MSAHEHSMAFQWLRKGRVAWLFVALALMFTSAYSTFRWVGVVGVISGWMGLPQYEAEIPKLQSVAEMWLCLAIASPFLAALLLGFGKRETVPQVELAGSMAVTYRPESQPAEWAGLIARYFIRLVISVLGTVVFALCLLLVGVLFHKH
jgi:hypothetical protein